MTRRKRTSSIVDTAQQRLSGLKGITPKAEFGPNLTEAMYEAKIASVSGLLNAYNQKIAELDQDQNDLRKAEAELNEMNRRFLAAGEANYGSDSNEYEMMGGTRKSERKKQTKKSRGTSGSDDSSAK